MNLVGKANSRRRERDLVRRFPSRLRGDVSRRFNLVNTPCHQRTRLGYIYIQMRGKTIGTLCTSTRYGVKMRFLLFVFFSYMQLAVFSFLFFKTGTVEDAKNAKKSHRRFPRTAGAFDLISRFGGSRCQDGRCGCGHWSLSYRKKQRKIHAGQSRTKCTSPTERVH